MHDNGAGFAFWGITSSISSSAIWGAGQGLTWDRGRSIILEKDGGVIPIGGKYTDLFGGKNFVFVWVIATHFDQAKVFLLIESKNIIIYIDSQFVCLIKIQKVSSMESRILHLEDFEVLSLVELLGFLELAPFFLWFVFL